MASCTCSCAAQRPAVPQACVTRDEFDFCARAALRFSGAIGCTIGRTTGCTERLAAYLAGEPVVLTLVQGGNEQARFLHFLRSSLRVRPRVIINSRAVSLLFQDLVVLTMSCADHELFHFGSRNLAAKSAVTRALHPAACRVARRA